MKGELVSIRVLHGPKGRCQERFRIPGKAYEYCLGRAVYAVTFVDPGSVKRCVKVCHKHLDIYLKLRFLACPNPISIRGDCYD